MGKGLNINVNQKENSNFNNFKGGVTNKGKSSYREGIIIWKADGQFRDPPNFEQHTLVLNKKAKKKCGYDSRLVNKAGSGGLKYSYKIGVRIRMKRTHEEDHVVKVNDIIDNDVCAHEESIYVNNGVRAEFVQAIEYVDPCIHMLKNKDLE
ncbi:unnamed protein product [Vicia faba]|uniref:Uncharacterized protein n=1 Tax=Vicia faba TaxID=3906 RepID=A0AAV1ASV3_VICFA|nr:unnamed protein product [Vicia faba]